MKRFGLFLGSLLILLPGLALSQPVDSWISTASGTWSTAANWSLAQAPSASTGAGISIADYPGTATLQRTIDLAGGTGRVCYGNQFDLVVGGIGYTFSGTAGTVSGFFLRAGGTVNGILNNDDNVQTFNVPIKLTSNSGIAGAAAAMVFNAAAGDLIFNGNNNAPATPWTINLNGASNLTFSGAANITIGSSGAGQIVNTNVGTFSGLIKNGAGTLTLGGTNANTFVGTNVINAGMVLAAKVDAFGAGNALVFAGGTFNSGGLNQAFGTLDLRGNVTLDLGAGSSAVTFADSSAFDWSTFTLTIANWTEGSDSVRFGNNANALTATQVEHIFFGVSPAQIDSNGFLTPLLVPEPSSVALSLIGGFGLAAVILRRKKD
jgi:autotransporter-associated beta strand protein